MSRTFIHSATIELDHPIEHVWSLASSFGAIKAWMPAIKWCMVDGHQIGSTRTVMSPFGVAKEKLEVLDSKAHIISYRILDPIPLPAKGGFGTWKLESVGEDRTKLTWTADAEEVTDEGVATLKPIYDGFMKQGLEGFKAALL